MAKRYQMEEAGDALVIRFKAKTSQKLRERLVELGFEYHRTSRAWVGRENTDKAIFEVEDWNRRLNVVRKREATICPDCKKSGFGDLSECPWEREFKPVEGWEVIRNDITNTITAKRIHKYLKTEESYIVLNCPLFELEERSRK